MTSSANPTPMSGAQQIGSQGVAVTNSNSTTAAGTVPPPPPPPVPAPQKQKSWDTLDQNAMATARMPKNNHLTQTHATEMVRH